MGDTQRFAEKMNLTAMTPHDDLATTRYCLANPRSEYLVYQPKAGEAFSVNLKAGLDLASVLHPQTLLCDAMSGRFSPRCCATR
jgi:hypothetical protein